MGYLLSCTTTNGCEQRTRRHVIRHRMPKLHGRRLRLRIPVDARTYFYSIDFERDFAKLMQKCASEQIPKHRRY